MASPRTALRDWCRVTCACYPNVEIKNLSSSFRDGLAFCAIIHKHRPDLIDFSFLSKHDVYQNNKLAFEVAETKLGIPALLHPNDMVSTKVPDCLSVITYLSWYYYYFNRKSFAGLATSGPSHVTVLKSKTPESLKDRKSSTDLKSGREDGSFHTRPRTVCRLCLKPVHLIQRHLIDGKIYHRSCFRCTVCHCTLLPQSYTQGSDAGSLICTHHKSTQAAQVGSAQSRSECTFQVVFSLDGLPIASAPHYSENTESPDGSVCKTAGMEGKERWGASAEVEGRESSDCADGEKGAVKEPAPPHVSPPPDKDRTDEDSERAELAPVPAGSEVPQEATSAQQPPEHLSTCAQVTEGSYQPVPAPTQMFDSPVVPVPAANAKTSQTTDSCPAAGHSCSQHVCSSRPHNTSSSVKTNHPWLTIIHPGPWTQLPPVPSPFPFRRSWYTPTVPKPRPSKKDVDKGPTPKPEPADQTKSSVAASHAGYGGDLGGAANAVGASREPVRDTSQTGVLDLDETGNRGGLLTGMTDAAAAGPHSTLPETQSHSLPRSLSMPAVTCALLPAHMTNANVRDQMMSCQSKPVCKENLFDRKPAKSKSKTFMTFPSRQAPAPGHGFPLVKRKVQTDHSISLENLQMETRDLGKLMEEMEQRGVDLERSLRDCTNEEEEEQMLMEWFSLTHDRHLLVRRDTELGHLTMQQKLEERQADVEYEIRCLLSKQESRWTQDDRRQEQQLMNELVSLIERRNQIISSLDQDMQRERQEDMLFDATMKSKELQQEGLKELMKSKGKFSPSKFFKMLNHKAEGSKDSMDKRS